MSSPQTAADILDRTYLEIRAKILEVGASLDRLERAEAWEATSDDPRLVLLREGIAALSESGFERAEKIQRIFSDQYDPTWKKS